MNYIQQYTNANNLLSQIKQNLINDLTHEFETNIKKSFQQKGMLKIVSYKDLSSWCYDDISGKQFEKDFDNMCRMILNCKDLEKTLNNIVKYGTICNYNRNNEHYFKIDGIYKGFYKKIDTKLLGIIKNFL